MITDQKPIYYSMINLTIIFKNYCFLGKIIIG